MRRLSTDTAEFSELLEELLVPETWCFRDPLAFRHLSRFLDAWRSENRGTIRLLSVGCSTGEEVYSLAMALREAGFRPTQFFILGTDLSRRSLEVARKGALSLRSFREPEASIVALRDRWCECLGESWRVRDELRTGVEFQWGNLAEAGFLAGEAPFQVVFCRNVMIYFHSGARRVSIGHLRRLLNVDGFLCSAPAEARIFTQAGFVSSGGECPFAFARPDEHWESREAVAIATRVQGNLHHFSDARGRWSPGFSRPKPWPQLSPPLARARRKACWSRGFGRLKRGLQHTSPRDTGEAGIPLQAAEAGTPTLVPARKRGGRSVDPEGRTAGSR